MDVIGFENPIMDFILQADRLPGSNEAVPFKQVSWQGGGPVGSAMSCAGRLGAAAGVVGAVVDDPYGRFCLNDQPVFLRGFGHDSIFPLTIAPPADKREYLREFRIAKKLGFNCMRCHSYTPVTEAFEAADEAGLLIQAEMPVAYTSAVWPPRFIPYEGPSRQGWKNPRLLPEH